VTDYWHYLRLPGLWQGLWVAIEIAAAAMVLALVLGLLLALMRESQHRAVRWPAAFYVWFMRGTPLLLQLVFFYVMFPQIGIQLDPVPTAIIGFALNEAAFAGEIIRGGIRSVSKSQIVAAHSLGMSPTLTLRRVVLPQALRAIVPALGNDTISLLKATSLASVIAVNEVTLLAQAFTSRTFKFFPIFGAAATMYLLATTVLSIMQSRLERRFELDRQVSTSQRMFGRLPRRNRGPLASAAAATNSEGLAAGGATPVPAGTLDPDQQGLGGVHPRPAPTGIAELIAKQSLSDRPDEDFIVCRDVRKSYGDREILRGIDITIKPGEVVALMGPSGSGKSTFLRLINHLEPMDDGEILVDGDYVGYRKVDGVLKPSDHLARARANARIGFVFQHFNLFDHLPVLENITIAPINVYGESPEVARETAHGLLADVGLDQHAHHLPHRLSGGQQQRVAIARALAISPKLMLFDEPTSALDPELVGEVLNVIRRLADAGMTMLIVTHEVRFAREVADRVVFMDDGRVVEQGPPAQVFDHPTEERTRKFLSMVAREIGTF